MPRIVRQTVQETIQQLTGQLKRKEAQIELLLEDVMMMAREQGRLLESAQQAAVSQELQPATEPSIKAGAWVAAALEPMIPPTPPSPPLAQPTMDAGRVGQGLECVHSLILSKDLLSPSNRFKATATCQRCDAWWFIDQTAAQAVAPTTSTSANKELDFSAVKTGEQQDVLATESTSQSSESSKCDHDFIRQASEPHKVSLERIADLLAQHQEQP